MVRALALFNAVCVIVLAIIPFFAILMTALTDDDRKRLCGVAEVAAIIGVLAIVALVAGVLLDARDERRREQKRTQARKDDRDETVELVRVAVDKDRKTTARFRIMVDTVSLHHDVEMLLAGVTYKTALRVREEIGDDSGDNFERKHAIREDEQVAGAERFNRDLLKPLRMVVDPAKKNPFISVDPDLLRIAKNGAKTNADIETAYAALDDLSKQLILAPREDEAYG